jgi:hypothetical protein
MAENSNSSAAAIALAIAWIAFVLFYPLSWTPSSIVLWGLQKDYRAVPLKLPDSGPLRLMINRGSRVGLSWQKSSPGAAATSPLEAAPATTTMPAETERLDTVTVIERTCLGRDHQSDCYAVLSIPKDKADAVMRAGRVWVVVEQQ